MNRTRWAVVVAVVGLFSVRAPALASDPVWSQTGQITGASVCALAVSPNYRQDKTLWAGTPGYGLFVTHDAATHWRLLNLPNRASGSCPVVVSGPGDILVAVSDQAHASLDGGKTWSSWNLPTPPAAIAFSPHFATDRTVLAASDNGPIFRSTDAGATWSPVANWQSDLSYPGHLAFNLLFLPDGIAILSTGSGLFRSADGGLTWSWTNTGLPVVHDFDSQSAQPYDHIAAIVGVAADSSGKLYATARLSSGTGIFRSVDEGRRWSRVSRVSAVASTLIADGQGKLLLGTQDHGVLSSGDGGTTWETLSQGLFDRDVTALQMAPDGTLFAGAAFDGVFSRTATAAAWRPRFVGLPETDPVTGLIGVSSRGILAGTLTGIFRSTSGGATWREANRGLPDDRSIDAFARIKRRGRLELLAATSSGLFRSRNVGSSWTSLGPQLTKGVEAWSVAAHVVGGRVMIAAGTENGLFYSGDDGVHWRMLVRGDMNISEVQFVPGQSGRLYALCAGALEVYGTRTQHLVLPVVNGQSIAAFTASPSGGTLLVSTSTGVYRFDGRSRPHRLMAWPSPVQPVLTYVAPHAVALGAGSSLYVSRNDGRKWQRKTTPGAEDILALGTSSGSILVSLADRGVWRFHV